MIRFLFTTVAMALLGPGHVPASTMPIGGAARPHAVSVASAASARQLVKGARLVIADIERWQFTPVRAQRHPARAIARICRTAHLHHASCAAAPALDLYGSPSKYLRSGIAGASARHADMLVIQAESVELKARLFRHLVTVAVRQARRVRPHIRIFAELTTSTRIGKVTGRALLRAMHIARHAGVSGFWISIPGRSRWCKTCGIARPRPARWAIARWQW